MVRMTETPTLMLRHGIFHFRRAVPAKLRPFLKKREVVESLHTKDKAEAKVRVKAVGIKTDRIFEAAWRKHFALIENPSLLADQWKSEALRSDLEVRTEGPQRTEEDVEVEQDVLEDAILRHQQALSENDYTVVGSLVADLLRQHGITELRPEAMRSLSRAMLTANLDALRVARKRARGESSEVLEVNREEAENPPLSVVLERWRQERNPPSQTWSEWQVVFQRFRELVGQDLPVKSVTRTHVRNLKDALLRAPRRVPRSLRSRPFPEVIAQATAGPRLSAQSVHKALSAIQGVLAWALKQGYIETNPAVGLKPDAPRNAEERRLPYSLDHLKVIFTSPLYTGSLSKAQRSKPGSVIVKDASYWLPLLGAWTGCRQTELAQLLVTDVKEEDGITFLDIRGGDGKKVKTASSRRRVPIHSHLVKAGFVEFVREQKGPRIFSELRPDAHGKIAGSWSKWWARYSHAIGIIDSRLVFHSFRHSFKDACRRAGVSEETHDALTGHSGSGVGRGYGLGVPLPVLAEAIERISYPV